MFYSGSIGIEAIDIAVVLTKGNFTSHRLSKSKHVNDVVSNNFVFYRSYLAILRNFHRKTLAIP